MTRPSILILFLLIATLHATPLSQPGPVLDFGPAEVAWTKFFQDLAKPRCVYSTFREKRWFGFRKTPVVLEGEMRLDPKRGLSLHYTQPDDKTIVMDQQGLVLRDARGRSRDVPSDPRAGGIEQALLPALRFDLPVIRASFVVRAARGGADWRLDLEPKDEQLRGNLGDLVIEGTAAQVTRLEFRRSSTQRVTIAIISTRESAAFPAEELRRYFR